MRRKSWRGTVFSAEQAQWLHNFRRALSDKEEFVLFE